jgi:tripartite-type tricarboxylate transporter receptor subunit TctC
LFAPKGTPEPVLKRLSDAAAQAAALPEMKEKLLLVAQNVEYQSNVEFARQVRDDQIYFAQLLKDLDIKLE